MALRVIAPAAVTLEALIVAVTVSCMLFLALATPTEPLAVAPEPRPCMLAAMATPTPPASVQMCELSTAVRLTAPALVVVTVLFVMLALRSLNARLTSMPIVDSMLVALLSGFLAPVAKDLVTALQQLRSRVR